MAVDAGTGDARSDVDVVVVGAGFSGLYLLHRLRGLGFSTGCSRRPATSAAPGTGTATPGPAATFRPPTTPTASIPNSSSEWKWSEKYATQPEILSYLGYVADRYDLRRDISFSTRVESGRLGRGRRPLAAATDKGDEITCRTTSWPPAACPCPSRPTSTGRPLHRRDLFHQPVAPRAGRLHRQAGGGDRHRLVGHPVHPGDRRPGGPADRLPAHRQLLVPAHNGPPSAERLRRPGGRPGRLPGSGPVVPGRRSAPSSATSPAARPPKRCAASGSRARGQAGELFGSSASSTTSCQPGGQRDRGRAHPREDPRDRRRPRDGGGASARTAIRSGPSGCASTPLLRDLQPPPRPPGRPAHARRSRRSPSRASNRRASPSTSTPSSSPPVSTP